MTPEEVAFEMREHGMKLLEIAEALRARDANACDPQALLAWVVALLESSAEDKWSTAAMLEEIAEVAHLELEKRPRSLPSLAVRETEQPHSVELVAPPFAFEFFTQHDDI